MGEIDTTKRREFTRWEKFKKTFLPKVRTVMHVKSLKITSEDLDLSKDLDSDKTPKYEVDDPYENDYESFMDKLVIWGVKWSGDMWMFIFWMVLLVAWIVWGIVCKGNADWNIVMLDVQSIQSYFWDTLIMRQQMDDHADFLKLYGRIKSRDSTYKRILRQIAAENRTTQNVLAIADGEKQTANNNVLEISGIDTEKQTLNSEEVKIKSKTWFEKFCVVTCDWVGSLSAVTIYWIGILVWIGCGALIIDAGNTPPFTEGPYSKNPEYGPWGNNWQMYINTATAVELLITTVLLENARAQANGLVMEGFELLDVLDCKIEALGRQITHDDMDNETITVNAVERLGFRHAISMYAEFIGTGVGLILTVIVFVGWILAGHPMGWDANWWLIIGTYTGLIGFFDGFVLREVFKSITVYEQGKFLDLLSDSQEMLDICGIGFQLQEPQMKQTLGFKISRFVNDMVSSIWSVVASFLFILALIGIASGMLWNETGQLIANTPTMIIEGFCLLVLIQAANWADYFRRCIVDQLTMSRKLIMRYIEQNVDDEKFGTESEPKTSVTESLT